MLTPNNAVDYSQPFVFDCGTPDQQAAFLADAFHFYRGTYTYTTNPGVKMSGIVFVATANGAPVYYADFIPN
jgi:hypothetical protein